MHPGTARVPVLPTGALLPAARLSAGNSGIGRMPAAMLPLTSLVRSGGWSKLSAQAGQETRLACAEVSPTIPPAFPFREKNLRLQRLPPAQLLWSFLFLFRSTLS